MKLTKISMITIQKKKLKTLIVFHDKIADMVSNKNLDSIVTKK